VEIFDRSSGHVTFTPMENSCMERKSQKSKFL